MLRRSPWVGGLLAVLAFGAGTGPALRAQEAPSVRPAYCAGGWYPTEPALTKEIDDLLAKATPPQVPGRPVAIISPHAGYRYSAPVAAAAYAGLRGQSYKRVIALAFSHRAAGSYRGVDVPKDLTAYSTPLGQIPIDRKACEQLLTNPVFSSHVNVDAGEHSLELQLPFLQRVIKDFALVPLLIGQMTERDYAAAAKALAPLLDDVTLLVASSDCTHFGPDYGYTPFKDDVENKLRGLAEEATATIVLCDYDGFVDHLAKTGDTICGRGPISLLLRTLATHGGAQAVRAAFDTSGHITGDWTNSVTYQSFVFTRRAGTLGATERAELLRLARQTVAAVLRGEPPTAVTADTLPAAACREGACFVTLENQGRLRGCIGNMVARGPLYQAVIDNAVQACRDHRFVDNPVTARELDQLHIEISYLTPMKRVSRVEEIVVGRDGLHITLGRNRGVLLPQVAYELGWTRQEFLAQVCNKAGLPPDAWRRPEAQIDSFQAEVFGEP